MTTTPDPVDMGGDSCPRGREFEPSALDTIWIVCHFHLL